MFHGSLFPASTVVSRARHRQDIVGAGVTSWLSSYQLSLIEMTHRECRAAGHQRRLGRLGAHVACNICRQIRMSTQLKHDQQS